MSVLKAKRTTSSAEFVNTANEIYIEVLNFFDAPLGSVFSPLSRAYGGLGRRGNGPCRESQ